jgi:hypothetical protein
MQVYQFKVLLDPNGSSGYVVASHALHELS